MTARLRYALLALAVSLSAAEDPQGAEIYKQRCAMCHERSSETRAPAPAALRQMSPQAIVKALESGLMKQQGASLTAAQRISVATFLAAKPSEESIATVDLCVSKNPFSQLATNVWNGWSADHATNARFQSDTDITASNLSRLKLKWAFAFKGTFVASAQPSVVGGRVFVASANRNIYSLDAKTGCQQWAFQAEAPVRTAVTIASPAGRSIAFFGDQKATSYAVDATTGELVWKVHVDPHPKSKIVGSLVYHDGRIYVPITAGEEGPQLDPKYECCSGRGGIAALDAKTGKQIWKTSTIAEEAKQTGVNWVGTPMWGPSGASIWSAPTIDVERKLIYGATGDNFSSPATTTSDAIIAFDLATGKIVWTRQFTANDVFNMNPICRGGEKTPGCPDPNGPDFDFGASPILVKLADGKRVLIGSQKSGHVHALDPDHEGQILWQARPGEGGTLGGIQWGSASDGRNVYAAVSDIRFKSTLLEAGRRKLVADPKAGGGLYALDLKTGAKVWSAPPPQCGDRPNCSPAQSAAITAIPGVVFSGGVDGRLRAYSTIDGSVLWDFDTAREFETVNGGSARGGSMDGAGPAIAGGMLFVGSGYGAWGGLPGNVLLAFSLDGK